jgi:putative transposase
MITAAFAEVFRPEGLRVISALPKAPWMNAICERVTGTFRRELLDQILSLGKRRLALVLGEYVALYNGLRPHQSRRQQPPDIEAEPVRDVADLRPVRRERVAAGVINEYHRAA